MMRLVKTLNRYLGICLFVCGVAISSEDPDAGRPGEHICPITLERMRDPVVAADGYSYEREALPVISAHEGLLALSPPEAAAAGRAESMGIPRGVSPIAVGYEAVFERFLRGVLVYKPNGAGSDVGRVDVPIASLADPLAGTFDLSGFGDTGNYISIHTGYKKAKIAANANKVEIWVTPKFLAERELGGAAAHLRPIMDRWESPVAYFWTWGGYDVAADNYDYLLPAEFCNNNELTLYQKWQNSVTTSHYAYPHYPFHPPAHSYITHAVFFIKF